MTEENFEIPEWIKIIRELIEKSKIKLKS